MKKQILVLLALTCLSCNALAANSTTPLSAAQKKALLKTVSQDVMLRAALSEARKSGEKCTAELVNAVDNGPGGVDFEAQFNCSIKGDEYVGGGVVLMINVKGTSFGDFLDGLLISVHKAD